MIDLADIKENLSDVLTDYFNNEKFETWIIICCWLQYKYDSG